MYSGHYETVGGDARYFFDLISRIDKKNFNITSFTDKNADIECVIESVNSFQGE